MQAPSLARPGWEFRPTELGERGEVLRRKTQPTQMENNGEGGSLFVRPSVRSAAQSPRNHLAREVRAGAGRNENLDCLSSFPLLLSPRPACACAHLNLA